MRKIAIWLCLITPFVLKAQPQFDLNAIAKRYQSHTVVVLNREVSLNLDYSGGKFKLFSDNLQQLYHIDTKNHSISERQLSYSLPFFEIKSLEANAWIPGKDGKLAKQSVNEFVDEGELSDDGIFYDDTRYKKFRFTSLQPGSITEVKFRYVYYDPSYLGGFYFQWGSPHNRVKYTVRVGKNVKIGYRFFGDSSNIKHSITQDGSFVIHTWEAENLPGMKTYEDAVDERYYEPHLFVYIDSYNGKNGWEPLFGNTARLYKHDYKYISKLNQGEVDPKLKLVADSIKSVSKNADEIAKGVYSWIQQNMKYIAFENGMGGQIPREANDVFIKRYGDCKDFACLITYMMKLADVKSYMCWIGSRSLPYTYEQLPLGYASNHMIAAYHNGQKWLFLDGTSKHTEFGVPSGFTQGKDGLIAISADSFVVERVPIMHPDYNYSFDSSYITLLPNGSMDVNVSVDLYGYNRSNFVEALYYAGTRNAEERAKGWLKMGNNKCEVKTIKVGNYDNNALPVNLSGKLNIPDYAKIIDQDLYVNLNLRKPYIDDRIDTSGGRIAPKEFEYLWTAEYVYYFEIPEGYVVKKMPSNWTYKDDMFSANLVYTQENNRIVVRQKNTCNTIIIEQKDFKRWNQLIDQILKTYKDNLVLSKKK